MVYTWPVTGVVGVSGADEQRGGGSRDRNPSGMLNERWDAVELFESGATCTPCGKCRGMPSSERSCSGARSSLDFRRAQIFDAEFVWWSECVENGLNFGKREVNERNDV